MSRFGRLCGLVAALAGLAAAHALALELPPTPGVTVTVPSLPVTTAPPPPLPPAPTLPIPAPTVPIPAPPPVTTTTAPPPAPPVTVPTPPRATTSPAPRPVAPPIVTTPTPSVEPTPSAPANAPGSGGSAGTTTSPGLRSSSTQSSRPTASNRADRLRATPRRSPNRVSVRLDFELAVAKRVFLIVRGPAPSCSVVGAIPVRGRRGANTVDFAGRVDGRNLRPGGYVLSLSPVRRPSDGAPTTFVEVISKRRSIPARPGAREPVCTDAHPLAAVPHDRFLPSDGLVATPAARATGTRDAVTSVPPANSDEQHDVLGVATPGAGLDSDTSADLESLITIGILTLIGAILLTTIALVTRFLRGSWNP